MICKKCNLQKDQTKFYTSKTSKSGYHTTCKDCMKAASKEKVKANMPRKVYQIPDGQGGKWKFNISKFNLNNPEANYIYGLIAVLGRQNKNVSRRNHKNIMMVCSNRKPLEQIAKFLDMNDNAVYVLPRAEEKKVKPKYGLILYHDDILGAFDTISNLRREDYKRGKLDGLKYV